MAKTVSVTNVQLEKLLKDSGYSFGNKNSVKNINHIILDGTTYVNSEFNSVKH